jgi:hypothetical protein
MVIVLIFLPRGLTRGREFALPSLSPRRRAPETPRR